MKAGWEQSYEWPANLLLVLFRVHEEIGWKIVVREAISGLQLGDYRRHRCFWKWHLLCFNYIDSVGVYSDVASGAYHTAQWDSQGNSSEIYGQMCRTAPGV